MIVYSSKPIPLIKGCLLSRIKKVPCAPISEDQTTTLFISENNICADERGLEELILEYRNTLDAELSWLMAKSTSRLYARISYALRHNSSMRFVLIERAVLDAFDKGLDYCLFSVSLNCRKFNNLAREVSHEVHRMLGFIRFIPYDDLTLVAAPKLEHNTADLILKKFYPRYPGYKIVLLLDNKALAMEKGRIFPENPIPYHSITKLNDTYASTWEKYYESQYIPERKNIPLAQKAIPQKYWDWMTEGKILSREKFKKQS